MRIEITPHAVDRYHERFCPEQTRDEAHTALRILCATARATKALTLKGDPIWESDGVRLVMRHDRRIRAAVVVTVLPAKEEARTGLPDEDPRGDALTIEEPRPRTRMSEWELAQAERAVRKAQQDLADAGSRVQRANDAAANANRALEEAKKKLEELKENAP